MRKTVVICVVGLSQRVMGEHTPFLSDFRAAHGCHTIRPALPAVTCTAHATYLTGKTPAVHGAVGNGWYFKDECEVKFWRQSNKLVQSEKLWETARRLDPTFTCANLFWWYNMYSSADYSVTPRPMYPADGRKFPDIYTQPATLRDWLQSELGQFPLFHYWGPAADISPTRWIANAALLLAHKHDPTLTLIYLPHLDYCFQKHGPDPIACSQDLRDVDAEVQKLAQHYQSRGANIVVLSEYGITPVSRPVHLNRRLREAGLIAVREELGRELLDAGASAAFAVADHQIAHVYVNDAARLQQVHDLCASMPGVAAVLDEQGKREAGLDHPRSGDFVVLAQDDAWFTYYYWLDDAEAPDFARTVDIHRKPGYDPAELFLDPALAAPKLKIAWTLLRKKLGFRTLLEVIPLSGERVKGSHGLLPRDPRDAPVLMSTSPSLVTRANPLAAEEVCGIILDHLHAAP